LSYTEDPVWRDAEAEEFIGVSPGTLAAWRNRRNKNQPAWLTVGSRAIRYRRSELIAWLDANTVRPGGSAR